MHHLFLSEVPTELQQYGVFAALAAVAAMIVVAVGGIARLWRGPLTGWEVPGQPPFLNRIVTLPSGFFLVFGFLYATPETLWLVLIVGGILAFISTIAGGIYATMTMKYRRVKKVIVGDYRKRPAGDH